MRIYNFIYLFFKAALVSWFLRGAYIHLAATPRDYLHGGLCLFFSGYFTLTTWLLLREATLQEIQK